ncbi:hypothetical protein Y032_0030g2189 [Ancylostoma ceylanicum]|uniref:Uncharacterized protein n=1 Tax=Ancylostoma ceylanicum TaxID=53326 RepID=A0A016URU2_9BILA|nr:hypothetical protein Y032_0030g2189 [Ancylostoma ceylanicum]
MAILVSAAPVNAIDLACYEWSSLMTPQQPPSCVLQTDLRLSAPKSAIFRHFVGKPCTQPGCCLAFAELHEQHLVFVTSLVVVMSS